MPADSSETVDRMLKSLLVLARATENILEKQAVKHAVKKPLSSSKVQILRLLANRGPKTSTQIARFLHVTKSAVSQIVDSMVRSRMLVRRKATADRREVTLALAERGRAAFRGVIQHQQHLVRLALRMNGSAQNKRWVETLEQIAKSVAGADVEFHNACMQCEAHIDGSCVLADGSDECSFLKHEAELRKRRAERISNRKTPGKAVVRKPTNRQR